ncbi:MAG: protein translocase subunit SecD [Halobacteriovorax sp.]|nr:protein translocase subunit SecD [Halobacteriovorax sp.]|tara:strand:+ start:135968 stop:137677 length:1710 start_codon:yes stop_codon:yes gene_type:complete
MKRSWWYRFTFLLVVSVMAIVTIIPTALDFKEESNYPVKSKINLGLDLQGGLYMILGIDFNKVYLDEIKGYARRIEFVLKDEGIGAKIGVVDTTDITDPKHSIILTNADDHDKAVSRVKQYFGSYLRLTSDEGGTTLQYGMAKVAKTQIEEQSVSKSIEVIRNRIDEFGVTEPEIISQGNDRIIVQLPGVKDIERAKELIGRTAKLSFKMVNDEVSPATIQGWLDKAKNNGINYKKGTRFSLYIQQLNEYLRKDFPAGYELAFEKRVSKFNNEIETQIPYLIEANPKLTGEELQDARVQIDQQKNEPYVSLEFKSQGAKLFEQLTAENVGKRMAIVLDGNVYSAPNIREKIGGGRAQITLGAGNFNKTMREARDLALVLRAGALPVQLDFEEQRSVGPSLGQDSIVKARYASLIGCVMVFLFILVYYKIAGGIAMITLGLNILFILAALVGLEATLTLPGIAGIALTVGMAVDSNVIIYERIREEIRKGVGNYKAVESGFESAFLTIIDANLTTALAGLCLLNFGTGPIRGFAVTLLIGIVATVYTSYFVGRLLFEFYMNKVEGQELSI